MKWRCYKVVWSIFNLAILSLSITRLWDILYKGMLKWLRGWLLRGYVIYLCKWMLQCLQGGDVTWVFEAFLTDTVNDTVECYQRMIQWNVTKVCYQSLRSRDVTRLYKAFQNITMITMLGCYKLAWSVKKKRVDVRRNMDVTRNY